MGLTLENLADVVHTKKISGDVLSQAEKTLCQTEKKNTEIPKVVLRHEMCTAADTLLNRHSKYQKFVTATLALMVKNAFHISASFLPLYYKSV